MMYQFNGCKMNDGINPFYVFYSKKDLQNTNLLTFQVVPKIVGSIPPGTRIFLFFHAVYRGKFPVVLKTAGARHVFIPLSYGK
jgi:hypothetical protein